MPKEKVRPRVDRRTCELGAQFGAAGIADNRRRWGSGTVKDNITLNWRLIKAPMFVIDCAIVRKLAHPLESNRTPRFRSIIRANASTMGKATAWLKDNGQALEQEL